MEWVRAMATEKVDTNECIGSTVVGGHWIAIFCVEGQYYATSNICTHGRAPLSKGYLEGYLIECPLHQGRFDVRTGQAVAPPCTENVRSFPVKLDGGYVYVDIG